MFDHVVLRQSEDGLPISIGQIAEALLYYQKVHLFMDRGTLFKLIAKLGTDRLLKLLGREEVSAVYCDEILCINTSSIGVSQFHDCAAFRLEGHKSSVPFKAPEERLCFELERQGIRKAESRSFSQAFLKLVPVRRFSGNNFLDGGIPDAARSDLLDIEYARQAFRKALALLPGGYEAGDNLKFEVTTSALGLLVVTDANLASVNQKRAQALPPLEPITIAHLLSNILNARADLALASFYGGDFVTSEVTSAIIQVRHAELLRRTKLNLNSRRQFSEIVIPDSPSLAEVIDSGERSFDDFLNLLDRADRFKDWLKAVNPDVDLIRTYLRNVSSEGWIQRLPAKILRYVLTTGLGAVNPAVGLVSGFANDFLLEKMFSGWRPNHFVSRKLSPFVQGQ